MKRKILYGLLLLIVVAAIIGYRLYSKKVTNYANETPDITITAEELIKAFDADTAAAGRRFMDKIIRVSGLVKTVDSSAVVLGSGDSPSDVVVGLDDRNLDRLNRLKTGQPAVLQGKFSGYYKAGGDDLLSSLGTTVKIDYAGITNP